MRVLLVEDEPLIAMMLGDMVEQAGHEIAGEAASVEDALRAVEQARPDAALVDLNLNGTRSDPVLARLREAGVPFAIASGYGVGIDPEHGADGAMFLAKPYVLADVEAVLSRLGEAAA